MRKLSTLILVALLAAPALCSATTQAELPPAENYTTTSDGELWIALGTSPLAVKVAPPRMVTICYMGVTVMVPQKIARRYLKIGARCGSCEMDEQGQGPGQNLFPALIGSAAPRSVCEEQDPCDDWIEQLSGAIPCDVFSTVIDAPASAEKAVQIGN